MQRRLLTGVGLAVLGLGLVASGWGCTRACYRRAADREVYGILSQKASCVSGMEKDFTIEPSPKGLQRACPPEAGQKDEAAQEGAPPKEPKVLTLAEALEIAAQNSRSYQSQKETVYISALNLTAVRYRFDAQPFARADGEYFNPGTGPDSVSGGTSFGFSWLLKTGAAISMSLASDFSQFLSGHPARASSSLFNATITQPILQGAGIAVTEPLTQAERDVIYQIRDFVQFRRSFFVGVLTDYYRVLENRKVLDNEERNYRSLLYARNRAEALSRAGQLPPFQVDQAEQDLLQAQDRVVRAQQSYESSLDSFRITLGLPPDTDITLDPQELDRLTTEKSEELPFNLDQAVQLALVNRLDLMTANDEVADARRKVEVAGNDLLPGLDLNAGVSASTQGRSNPANFDAATTDFNAGFELDLPLDRLNERNTYRRSLITLEQNKRNQCQVRDGVVQDVRDTWRQFQRTSSSYQISLARQKLASERVQSTEMQLEAGRAIVRDVLDAQSSLLSAQNDLAAAIVDYRVSRLDLAVNMDTLSVSETGQLKENFDEYFRPQSQ